MSDNMVRLIADIFPASITPMPEGVPSGLKLRVIIAEDQLVVAWSGGKQGTTTVVHDWSTPIDPATNTATFRGGQVAEYTVGRGTGCACGAAGLKNWNPFDGRDITVVKRTPMPVSTGVTRYTRD